MVIDLKEIPYHHAFENFCMHLLEEHGAHIPVRPAIGPDGGRDIICEEPIQFGSRGYRWLVSCKHYAYSGRPVGVRDDAAIANKLAEHDCNGFMFFCSTSYTEGFVTSVNNICNNKQSQSKFFNCYDIERILLSSPKFYPLIRQYFPNSHNRLTRLFDKEICCLYYDPRCALYAVYTQNSNDQSVGYKVYGECCIDDVIEHLRESGCAYGYCKIRSASQY
ncbi:restriction endonuclease [Halomonas coralii]|nr:restriction endonuclease [Modicisalibacter sp. R2A 31.J]MBZ9576802.1 restriction endonuclease [Modicisalibacter sp. MOD 31.J]